MPKSTTRGSSLVAIAVSAVLTATAFANESKTVDVPAGDLTDALEALVSQAGIELVYRPEHLEGLRTRGVQGTLSPEQAVTKLIAGTTLTLRADSSGVLLISRALPDARSSFSATAPGTSLRLAQAAAATPAETMQAGNAAAPSEPLQEIVVTGVNFNDNNLVESTNKMPMTVKDTPQSIKVVTSDMLNFASIDNFNDVYKLDAGMHASHSGVGYSWSYFRGFATGFAESFKVDGFRVLGRARLDLAPYERMEIVKGATSTLYGQSSVAGTLNAVSKKPQGEFGGSLSLETGTYGHYRGDLDVYGPLSADGRLSYRFVAAYLDEESHLDFAYREQFVLAPSLKFEIGPRTSVLAQVNYQKFDYLPYTGYTVQYDGGDPAEESSYHFPDVPRSRLGGAPWANADRTSIFARTVLEHAFENDWKLRGNLQYSNIWGLVKRPWMNRSDAGGTTPVDIYFDDSSDPLYSAEVNLFGDVELLGRKHTLFVGADYADIKTKTKFGGAYGNSPGFNILDPDYSLLPQPTRFADFTPGGIYEAGGLLYGGTYAAKRAGMTGQAVIRPTDKLTFLLGARFSRSEEQTNQGVVDSFDNLNPVYRSPDTEAWTYQAGATYAISRDVNVYVTYGETFEPRNAFAYDPSDVQQTGPGIWLGPEEGVTYEAGLKGELFSQKFSWSLALFDTERTNVAESDIDHPNFMVALGRQRSKGVELDFQGEVLEGWDIYTSAVAMDNEFTEGELTGTPSPFTTKLGLSMFTSYEIQSGPLAGLGFGGGLVYKERPDFHALGVVFTQLFPDYTELDLRAFYDRGPWRFQLAATNVLDEKYYSASHFHIDGNVYVNPPAQVIGTVTRKF